MGEDPKDAENHEWIESLDNVYRQGGAERVRDLLWHLHVRASKYGVRPHFTANTPYINTIPRDQQPAYPGNREMERRIKSLIRWNAMAMVVRANREEHGIGGHISSYASAATLLEVGFNHFFRGKRTRAGETPSTSRATPRPGRLCAGLPGGAAHTKRTCTTFAESCAAGRHLLLSASLPDARILGVPDGLHGP